MADVLIIDDDIEMCLMLSDMVRRIGHSAVYKSNIKEGLREVFSRCYDVVLLDVMLPDGNGLEALQEIRKKENPPEVIIITGEGDPDGAELAVTSGAWDYLQKPLSPKKLLLPLTRVFQYHENLSNVKRPIAALKLQGIIGGTQQMRTCFDSLARSANSTINVLITGETGTGKELFARAIHDNSPRADKPFVVIDCTVLPRTLVESVLFGHVKGAFTDALKDQEGLISQADGGTLFLDEIAELTADTQRAFLRVLQEKKFRPVGGDIEKESDFRLISATNKNLDALVQKGRFRNDLLFRLRAITIGLPPLRERPEDIIPLVMHYLTKICETQGLETKGLAPDFIEALVSYHWPGNIRELIGNLESAIIGAYDEPILFSKHLPTHIRVRLARTSIEGENTGESEAVSAGIPAAAQLPRYKDFRESVLSVAEKKYLLDLMSLSNGSIKTACEISGLARTTLYNLMKKYDISRLGWFR